MQDASVRERVRRVLERHASDERMLDAYWQWASNPTPPSAGYALEENCGFIATNLLNRYGRPAIDLVSALAEEVADLRQEASICDLRQAITAVLGTEVGETLRVGVAARLNEPTPARQTLAMWLVTRAHWFCPQGQAPWVGGELDWALGLDLENSGRDLTTQVAQLLECRTDVDLSREALAVGIVNRLFYRTAGGRMEPRLRPGPRIPVGLVTY